MTAAIVVRPILVLAGRGTLPVASRYAWKRIAGGLILSGGVVMAYDKGKEAWDNFEDWAQDTQQDAKNLLGSTGFALGLGLLLVVFMMGRRGRGRPQKVVNVST